MGAKKTSPFESEDSQKDELPSRSSNGHPLAPPTPRKSSSLESALQGDGPIRTSRSRTSIGSALDLMGFQRRSFVHYLGILGCTWQQSVHEYNMLNNVSPSLRKRIVRAIALMHCCRLHQQTIKSSCRGSSTNLPRIASNPMNLGIPRRLPGANQQFVEKVRSIGATSPILRYLLVQCAVHDIDGAYGRFKHALTL